MIEVTDLSRSWGEFRLERISLRVDSGQYMVVLGPCGSGKTLLLETIAGLHTLESGNVRLAGEDVTDLPPEKRRVGLVYQQYALFPHLSVVDNIAYGLRYLNLSRTERRERVEEMLDLLHIRALADRSTPIGLSGGEAQKVALARALAIRPRVLLLDEPFSSLDQRARERIMDVLPVIAREQNVPVIHVTHDYTEAAALAHSIAVVRHGRIAQIGTPEQVFRRPRTRFVAEFLGVTNLLPAYPVRTEGDTASVRVGDVLVQAPLPAGVSAPSVPGSVAGGPAPLALCVRPEEIRIRPADAVGVNVFPGKIRELSDQGFHVRARIALDGAEVVAFVAPSHAELRGITVGQSVFVELPRESVHLMYNDPEISADGPA
ncbi:MAG: ABC transporter ATP-binding protein [Kiritimatiellaeota bacterium]|nr:ABC transporter ATP-binding protein [Kiritimatiellota bacterium]